MIKTVKLDNGMSVDIAKLPIGKYAELLRALKQLPGKLGSFTSLDPKQIISELPTIIADSLDDALEIVAIATPLKKEEVVELGLAEVIDLLVAVFEVNDYSKVIAQIKKVTAPQNEAKQPPKQTQ